jgi:hypothetical protein
MIPSDYRRKIFGDAQIINYNVGFEFIMYTLEVSNAMMETYDALEPMDTFQVTHVVPLENNLDDVTSWLSTPTAKLIEAAWREEEKDLMFEKQEDTHMVLLSLGGYAVLVPLPMYGFFDLVDNTDS